MITMDPSMLKLKNRQTLPIAFGTFMLGLLVHTLFRWLSIGGSAAHASLTSYGLALNLILASPLALFAAACFLYWRDIQRFVPLALALSMSLSSIAIIEGSGGRTELYFSSFMVIALMAFYESVGLIWTITGVFALHYVYAVLAGPSAADAAQAGLLVAVPMHALFLLLTAGTTVWQIAKKRQFVSRLESDKKQKQQLLRTTLGQLTSSSGSLVDYVRQLNVNAEHTLEANRQMTQAIGQTAAGAEEQASNSRESARAMEEISVRVQQIAESASVVSQAAEGMLQAAEEGSRTVLQAVDRLSALNRSSASVAEALEQLERRSQSIGEIATLISGVASQTNLLALNAAIEAARAGEHGAGFAIVASEVRKLAEQTEGSAAQISALIVEIQQAATETVRRMHGASDDVSAGHYAVMETGGVFERIVADARQVNKQIHGISGAAQEMSAGTQKVSASLAEMAVIAGSSADGAQQVLLSSEAQLSAMESISGSAEGLNRLAGELEQICQALGQEGRETDF
ncbi:methyl-accepting chemotaxis protein [Paenibacillus filicis]|uniref:Methyl-accepting chemotaxis protein n=1 Tax=Paenibacillus gyeongsangnamensis TaxID=3388067 RepID=A0ABT4QHI1_9BACL|nr:methyl-accepting chemotaxis protein [Paenibacillus filicis]MCZ8516324.1 methyl-accepting chemotaxis protein [Paenibacillus filicis]